jgi:hypothetical protein
MMIDDDNDKMTALNWNWGIFNIILEKQDVYQKN